MKKFFLFLSLFLFCFSLNYQTQNFADEYYDSILENENKFNIFYSGYIEGKRQNYSYIIPQGKESNQILFDFQSEYGCLYITFLENKNYKFCSEGKNNLFKIDLDSLKINDLNFTVSVGNNDEIEENLGFEYSLKVSLNTTNLLEVNSEHKLLCKTENIKDRNICLFVIINNNFTINQDLIVYAKPQNSSQKLKIYADYINPKHYLENDIQFFNNKIPTNNSNFTNEGKELDFIIIPKLLKDNYTYLCVEAVEEVTIELITQTILKNEEINVQEENSTKIFQLYNFSKNVNLSSLVKLENENIELSIVIIHGRMKTQYKEISERTFINDILDNRLSFSINLKENHIIVFNNINELVNDELGCIFYISFKKNLMKNIKSIDFQTSNKLILTNEQDKPLILFCQLNDIMEKTTYNLNFQFYNNIYSDIKISSVIVTQHDLYKYKIGNISLNNFSHVINDTFNRIFSSVNIYIGKEDISILDKKDRWLLVIINFDTIYDNLILGTTISQMDSLIYPSERIYHFGNMGNEAQKIVYRLRGVKQHHLMRLEFSANDGLIKWTVKRKLDQKNYMKNDTDLSFVTERFANGRELLTMYIENGEDIYLTIYYTKKIRNPKLTNYIFKYLNAHSNLDFRNYILKNDMIENDEDDNNKYIVKRLKNIKKGDTATYYLGAIGENNYTKYESLNTIVLPASKINFAVRSNEKNNKNVIFNIEQQVDKTMTYFINAYIRIISEENDIENFAYSYLIREGVELSEASVGLIIASICLIGIAFIIGLIGLINYCCKRDYYDDYCDCCDECCCCCC